MKRIAPILLAKGAFRTSLVWAALVTSASGADQKSEVVSFPARAADILVIENDYGRVRVETWESPQIEVYQRIIAPDTFRLENVNVAAVRLTDRVYVRSYFYDYQAESVYLHVRVPVQTNVFIWAANSAVELEGIQGYVRAQTLSGLITAENLSESTSLQTESGDILFRSAVVPVGDIRLETIRGSIGCEIASDLDLHAWLRAGKSLSWDDEIEMMAGHLDKEVGSGGPLLYASSLEGDVRFDLSSSLPPASRVEPTPNEEPAGLRPSRDWPDPVPPPSSTPPRHDPAPRHEPTNGPGPKPHQPAQVPTSSDGGGFSLKVNVDWVHLNASVRDPHSGMAVSHLGRDDFLVYEDGVLQQIEKFQATEAPFHLLLLLDVSGSTRGYLDLMKDASVQFTRLIKENDRIAVAAFNSRTWLVQEFTGNRGDVERAIRRLRSGGGTAFYDALHESVTGYLDGIEGRKAVVVFSDGVDNQLTGDFSNGSRIMFRDLFRAIQEIDTLIYTILLDTEDAVAGNPSGAGGVGRVIIDILSGRTPPLHRGGGPRSEREAYAEAGRQMELIAEQTGARMYVPRAIRDLTHVYQQIADELRIQYSLGYHSANLAQDGRWRQLEVRVRNRPELVVRARKGYYGGRGDTP